jgi:hypothetical protein
LNRIEIVVPQDQEIQGSQGNPIQKVKNALEVKCVVLVVFCCFYYTDCFI